MQKTSQKNQKSDNIMCSKKLPQERVHMLVNKLNKEIYLRYDEKFYYRIPSWDTTMFKKLCFVESPRH